jgi:small subunit ribosomal protein S18
MTEKEAMSIEGKDDAKPGKRKFSGHEKPRPPVDLVFDYKDIDLLRRFTNEHAKIVPSRVNRLSAHQQRELAAAIKRARHLAMLPMAPNHGMMHG